nr:multidrug ABC transporter ATP-binding protein [Clostridia bacterium]
DRNILLEEKGRGATILIASHIKEDIDLLCDEKFKVEAGRIYPAGSEVEDE